MLRSFAILLTIFLFHFVRAQCPSVTVQASDSFYCHSDSVILTASGIPAGSTIEWNAGAGYDTAGSRYAFIASVFQNIDLDLRITLPSSIVCNYSWQDITFVQAPLDPQFDVSRTELCYGPDTILLIDNTVDAVQRSWVVNTQTYNNTPDTTIANIGSSGLVDITLIVDDSFGCRTVGYFYDTLRVFNDIGLDFTHGNQAHCVPYSTSFTSSFSNVNVQSLNWTFQGADNPTSTSANVSAVNYRNAGLFDVTLEVTTSYGCTYTITKEDYIELGEDYSLNLTYTDTVVCLSQKVLVEQTTNVQGRVTWEVDPGELIYRNRNRAEISYRDTGYHDLKYIIDHNGCISEDSLTAFIYARGSKAGFSSVDNIHCDTPHVVNFINESDTTTAGISGFEWNIYDSRNDSLMFSSTAKDPSFTIDSFPAEYDVQLIATDLQGCSDTLLEEEFISIGPYEFDITPDPPIVCPNGNVRFRNVTRNASPGSNETYDWKFFMTGTTSYIDSSTSRSPQLSFSDTGFYSFKLIVESDAGCLDSITVDSAVHVTEVYPFFEVSDTLICFNDSIQVFSGSYPRQAEFDYSWILTDSNTNVRYQGFLDTFNLPLTNPGVYSLKMIHELSSGFVNPVCQDSISMNLYANGVRGRVVIDTTSGCSPLSLSPEFDIDYNMHVGSSDSALQYNWTIQPSTNVTIENATSSIPRFTLYDEAGYRMSVFVTNSVGCSYYDLRGANIRVGVLARFRPNPDTFCVNNPIRLFNVSPGDPTSLEWNIKTTQPFTLDSIDFDNYDLTFYEPGTYEVELIVNKDNQCADTFSRIYDVIDISSDFNIVDSVLYCAPQQADFITLTTNIDSMLWFFGDGDSLMSDTSSISHIYQSNNVFDVMAVGTNRFGCVDTTTYPAIVQLVGPRIRAIIQDSSGCETHTVTFLDSTVGTTLSYMDYGDGSALDTSATGFTHAYTVSNGDSVQYYSPTLYVSNDLGCSASLQLDSAALVYAAPEPSIDILSDTAVCQGFPIYFQANGNYIDSVAWYVDDTYLSSQTSDTFIFTGLGYHRVKMLSFNSRSCADSTEREVFVKSIPGIQFDTSYFSCYDQNFTRSAIIATSGISATYSWDMGEAGNPNNLQSGTDSFATIRYQTSGLKNIYLDVSFSNGCISSDSTTAFVIGPDSIPPAIIDYVTVNAAGSVDVNYRPNNYRFFDRYELYKNGVSEYTTTSNSAGQYVDPQIAVDPNIYCYELVIVDQCGNEGVYSRTHCAVILTANSVNHKEIDLSWTPYVGWDSVMSYEIYRSSSSEPLALLTTVDGSITNYTDTGLCEDDYSYYVKAIQFGGSFASNSNIVDQRSLYIPNMRNPSIKRVTVNDLEEIELNWWASDYEYPMTYEVRKFEDNLGNEIGMFVLTDTFLYDPDVATSTYNYFYIVNEVDKCENVTTEGLYGKSILLQADFVNGAVQLDWTAYEQWLNGVDRYDVLIREFGLYSIVNTVNGNVLSYSDRELHQENINGQYEYKVRAIGVDNDTSYSNITFVSGRPLIYIPNAFSPNDDGHNEDFKPTMRFTVSSTEERPDDYHLQIYNRWGELMFETYNRDEGWDGNFMNEPAQQGAYFYKLKVTDNRSRTYRYKGSLTLLR